MSGVREWGTEHPLHRAKGTKILVGSKIFLPYTSTFQSTEIFKAQEIRNLTHTGNKIANC